MFRRHSDLDNDLAHCLPFKLDRSRVDTVLLYFPLAVIISFSTSRVCRTTYYLLTRWNEFEKKKNEREWEREGRKKKLEHVEKRGISAKAALRYAFLNQQRNSVDKTVMLKVRRLFKAQSKGSLAVSCLPITFT